MVNSKTLANIILVSFIFGGDPHSLKKLLEHVHFAIKASRLPGKATCYFHFDFTTRSPLVSSNYGANINVGDQNLEARDQDY